MRHILGLLLFLSIALGQVNDKNFKQNVNGGMVVVVVTAEWQEQELDEDILKGVKGYQDCKIIKVKSEDAPKVVKKLRFRNFPSLALLPNSKISFSISTRDLLSALLTTGTTRPCSVPTATPML